MTSRHKTLTKANFREWDKHAKRHDAARAAVFAAFESQDVPFSECLKASGPATQSEYRSAYSELWGFYWRMIDQGRAYLNSFGNFQPY